MLILGFDPSLRSFGWALHDTTAEGENRCPERGTVNTSKRKEGVFIESYIHHRESVRSLVTRLKPDKIAIEYPTFNQTWSEGQYGLFLFVIEALYLEKQDVVFLSNSATKAWARRFLNVPKGYGQIDKSDLIKAAKKHAGGVGVWPSDEADAYLIAVLGGRFWDYKAGNISVDDLTRYEKKKILEVKKPKRGKNAGRVLKKGLLWREDDRYFLLSELEED